VLVILALLAAILLPRVIDNIRLAKEGAEIAETQTVTVTLQALITLTYGNETRNPDGKSLTVDDLTFASWDDRKNILLTDAAIKEMEDLAGVTFGFVDRIVIENRVILVSFRYVTPHGSTIDYQQGQYFVINLY
jgi:type II secretory pathway pseudopilin PulG